MKKKCIIKFNIEEYNLGKKRKILIAFEDVIVDIINNEKT